MKKIELLGSSERSWEDATQKALATEVRGTSQSIHVTRFEVVVEGGRISQYRVRVEVSAGADGSNDPMVARVLVVDDLEPITALARSMLEEAGHKVHTAADGVEAVAAVQEEHYDLVLMDINMPRLDGIAATKAIRALDRPVRDVPIVAMTTNVLPEHVRLYKGAGMNGYVKKPLKQELLLQKLHELLPAVNDGERMRRTGDTVPGFDREAFDTIRATMGVDRVNAWLHKFLRQLEATFPLGGEGPGRESLGKEAHGLVSYSALLGFRELSRRCSDLEAACGEGRELASALHPATMAARNAEDLVRALLR